MHWLDSLSIRWLKRTPIFERGWGALEEVEAFAQTLRTPSPGKPLSITWGPIHRDTSLSVQDGTAMSPATILPSSLRTMHIRRVLTPLAAKKRLIVPPSWGDAGYGPRMFLAGALVARGIEVWLLEGAYFGKREAKIEQVEDFFFRMGLGHIDEVRSILETHHQDGLATSVAGYSMAGQLGSMAVQSVPYDVPVVAMACAPSPDTVFIEGPLSQQVQWQALGGDRERLRAAMRHVSVLDQPPPKSSKRLVALNSKDGIVDPAATRKMAAHWGVEPVELSTGHVGAYALNRRKLQDLIARTILD